MLNIQTREQYAEALHCLSVLMDGAFWKGDKYDVFLESFMKAIEEYEERVLKKEPQ